MEWLTLFLGFLGGAGVTIWDRLTAYKREDRYRNTEAKREVAARFVGCIYEALLELRRTGKKTGPGARALAQTLAEVQLLFGPNVSQRATTLIERVSLDGNRRGVKFTDITRSSEMTDFLDAAGEEIGSHR